MTSRKRTSKSYIPKPDRYLMLVIFIMLVFGIVIIYDATVAFAQSSFGEAYKFVLQHLIWVAAGLIGFFFFYNYNYKSIEKIAYPAAVISLGFLFLLAFMGVLKIIGVIGCSSAFPLVPCVNGAYRWFYFNPKPLPKIPFLGVLGFQPAEFAKFALVLYLSVQMNKLSRLSKSSLFGVYLVSSFIFFLFVLLQPNMSTAVLLFLIGTIMYFSANAPLLPLAISFPILTLLGGFAVVSSSYRRQRLLTLLHGSSEGLGYHMKQVLIALGSGGFWGLGFGQSRQKYQYLPEVSADSIFAIIGEELGFLGTVLVIVLFGFFIYKGLEIAKHAPDLLGRLLAVGITSRIGIQFFVNVAAMTKLLPLTGVPIPLISYGGSSTVFSLMGLGVLANVSRYSGMR